MKTNDTGRASMGIGRGQTMLSDAGPKRGEEMTNYNPSMKKAGEMKGGPDDLSHSISSGRVAPGPRGGS